MLSKLNYLGQSSLNIKPIEGSEELVDSVDANEETTSVSENRNNLKEIVTTQLSQVAYHLRQKRRAFDTACLLELLGKDFLERKSCIEASRDLSKSPSDEFRPKIFALSKNAQMVQLLLALSKDPGGDQPRSDFAKGYLGRKMRQKMDSKMMVRPHLAEYVQSDCQLIERDKTCQGRRTYLNFDNTSFENPLFAKQYEGKQALSFAQPYEIDSLASAKLNRFNIDLMKNPG